MVRPKDFQEGRGFGYTSKDFADSFEEFGEPMILDHTGGAAIIRSIPCGTKSGKTYYDAMGAYPLFFPMDLGYLSSDMHSMSLLKNGLVSFTGVLDPFTCAHQVPSCVHTKSLNWHGGIKMYKFKPHVIAHVSSVNDVRADYSAHHRYYVKKSIEKGLSVTFTNDADQAANDWLQMQNVLNSRKELTGIKRMSKFMIDKQSRADQLEVLRAHDSDGNLVGVSTWVVHNDTAYSHTNSTTEEGRRLLASYAMYDCALHALPGKYPELKYIDLGAYASVNTINAKTVDGLSFFKCGWAPHRLYTFLITVVLHEGKYQELQETTNTKDVTGYFPAYRNGEML